MSGRSLLAGVAAVACLTAGCGGGTDPKQEARQVVKDFATAVNKHDGKTFCNELVTRSYLEQVTLAKGKSAVRQCEQQISAQRLQQKYKVVGFDETKIDGDTATVTAQLEADGMRRPQVFRLKKGDGKFRLTSGATN